MSWEDFKHRSIQLWLFVVWGVLSIAFFLQPLPVVALNLSLVGIQIIVLYIYLRIKNWGKKQPLSYFIGSGDLLFIALVSVQFPPVVFVLSLLAALMLSILFGWVSRSKTQPMAGIYALVILILNWLYYSEVAFFQSFLNMMGA